MCRDFNATLLYLLTANQSSCETAENQYRYAAVVEAVGAEGPGPQRHTPASGGVKNVWEAKYSRVLRQCVDEEHRR